MHMSEGQCNTRRVSKLYMSTLLVVRSTPLADARQSASDRGVNCRPTDDSFGSGRSLAYDRFLMDLVVNVCGSRLGGQDKIGHGG